MLRQKWYRATGKERQEAWSDIQAFNAKNPAHRITRSSLFRGLHQRKLWERQAVRGVSFANPKEKYYYDRQTRFADID